MTIVANDFVKMLHTIVPDVEEFVHNILAQNLIEKSCVASKKCTQTSANIATVAGALNLALLNFRNTAGI